MNQREEFTVILAQGQISTVYQPIVSLKDGSVFAYEALSRIVRPSCSFNIETLFAFAAKERKLWELEKLCRTSALAHAARKPDTCKLFMNVDPNVMYDPEMKSGFVAERLLEYGLQAADIIIEITEKSAILTMEAFESSIDHYRAQAYQIAIDDFGSGYSGLNRVCRFSPDYLKLDMELVRGIDQDVMKKTVVGATIGFCKESGIRVIAEGIETEGELKTLIRLGVDYGQGFYLARPAVAFAGPPCEIKLQIKRYYARAQTQRTSSLFGMVETICRPQRTARITQPSIELYEEIKHDPEITEFFVVDGEGCICGILPKGHIMERYGGQFGYSLSKKLTAGQMMQKDVLVVETYMSIEEVASAAMQRGGTQTYDAIAVTAHGKYVGSVSVKDLLMTAIQIQVKRAAEASPLTGLPGNITIQEVITGTFRQENPWAIVYLDLDNFKAYNDAYGFTSGDLMIKTMAAAMQECCHQEDFLGHIGGDDFVIISSSVEVASVCEAICRTFHEKIQRLYSPEDWGRGYILSKNRNGFTQKFPIATLSIAAITNLDWKPKTMEELSKRIAETKKLCKQKRGDAIIVV